MDEMRSGPAAGWYADPAGSGGWRYWDGASWGAATVVAAAGVAGRPEGTSRFADEPWAPIGPVGPVGPVEPVAPPSYSAKRRWPLWVAIGVVGLGLLALLGAAAGKDDPSAAPSAITATSPPAPTIVATTAAVADAGAGGAPAAAPPTTAPPLGTRANPIPLAQAGVLTDADRGDITITVNAADLEGNAAVAAANMFNPPSSTGRYVVVNVTATYAGGQREQTASLIGAVSFSVSSHTGAGRGPTFVVAPEPQLDELADLFPGDTTTGNEAFEYEPGSAPLLRVEESHCSRNCDVLWFSLV